MYVRLRAMKGKTPQKALAKRYFNFLRKRTKQKGKNKEDLAPITILIFPSITPFQIIDLFFFDPLQPCPLNVPDFLFWVPKFSSWGFGYFLFRVVTVPLASLISKTLWLEADVLIE